MDDQQHDAAPLAQNPAPQIEDDPLARIAGLDAAPISAENEVAAEEIQTAAVDADTGNSESASDVDSVETAEASEQPDQQAVPAVVETTAAAAAVIAPPKRGWFSRFVSSKTAQLHDLTAAIDSYPDAPANYVLRGELFLELQRPEAARADFQRALALAESEFQAASWGLVAQATQDRAFAGLREAEKRLGVTLQDE